MFRIHVTWTLYCHKNTQVRRIWQFIFHWSLAISVLIEMLIRHTCEQEAHPKDLSTTIVSSITYSWAFSAAGRDSFSPKGFSFLLRWPQIFVRIWESALWRPVLVFFLLRCRTYYSFQYNTERYIKKKLIHLKSTIIDMIWVVLVIYMSSTVRSPWLYNTWTPKHGKLC